MKHLIISIILSSLLAFIALIKKAMTKSALFLSLIFALIITYYGGLSSFLILALTFVLSSLASKIKLTEKQKLTSNINQKNNAKDIFQIIANVGLGTLFVIIYHITNNSIFLVVYASIMAESLADTLASDIGVLSKKETINILTLKKGKPGLSGNISLLGLCSSFFGAFSIALIYALFKFNFTHFLIIIISGFLGALFDSFLGAAIQVKYECSKCHIKTEQLSHCNTKTVKIKGIEFFNNDLVNFISNLFSAIISLFLLYLF